MVLYYGLISSVCEIRNKGLPMYWRSGTEHIMLQCIHQRVPVQVHS